MQQQSIRVGNIFSQYLQKESIFKDKKALTSSFIPDKIRHRDAEIKQLTAALAPVLRGYHPNNLFIYGTCGTGKTIVAKFLINQLSDAVRDSHSLKVMYINCKMKKVADTEYRLLSQMLREFGECVPDTGLPTDVLYRRLFERIERNGNVILVLDEIDTLVKKVGDDFLYNFTRINTELKRSHVTIIGITNDLSMRDSLDLRVKSSLSDEEIIFRPYDANQLKEILGERISQGFKAGAVHEAAISKCAALAAQEHGDARRALDLLRVAGEIAERAGEPTIEERHVDLAEEKIDMDRISETIKSQPTQSQAVLYSIITQRQKSRANNGSSILRDSRILTGDVFDAYVGVCRENGISALTQRRISDLIGELDMLGVINAKVVSKGRYGRTREINLSMSDGALGKVVSFLEEKFA